MCVNRANQDVRYEEACTSRAVQQDGARCNEGLGGVAMRRGRTAEALDSQQSGALLTTAYRRVTVMRPP